MRHLLAEWSKPAVRQVVTWALPTLERRLSDAVDETDLRGEDLTEQLAVWIAETVKDFRRQSLSGALTALDAGEPVLAAARQALLAELAGLGRLQPLLDDEQVNDIHVVGHDTVFVITADGAKATMPSVADSDEQLIERFQRVAARGATARSWDRAHPTLDLRLASGHRLSAVMEVTPRPTITIRRPSWTLDRLEQFVGLGSLSEELARFLGAAVRTRLNIVVAGGQGAGKTTLMRAMLNEVPSEERIVTAEDARELRLDELVDTHGTRLHPDVVPLETREANSEGAGRFDLSDCLHLAKRLNPDRVVVGEVRSVEAGQMVDAMLGSAGGSMCTVHASSSHKAIGRLRSLMTLHGTLGEQAAMELLCDAVDLVVYQVREPATGRRYVAEVAEVAMADGQVTFHDIFVPGPDGRAVLRGLPHHLGERLRLFGYTGTPTGNGQVIR